MDRANRLRPHHPVGRQLSAVFDLLTVLLVFLIAYKLYNQSRLDCRGFVCLCRPADSTITYFMTVDTFTNTFLDADRFSSCDHTKQKISSGDFQKTIGWLWKSYWPYLLFGVALGMATASKINAVSLALLASPG